MSKMSGALTAGYQGKLGNSIGYMWRGKWCMRSMPSQYNDAHTEQQVAQRGKFKLAVGLASKALRVLKVGLRAESMKHNLTESNYFFRINKDCLTLIDNDLSIDYESLQLSDGPVAPVAFNVPQLIDDTTISIDFEKNPLHRVTNVDDMVYLVAYCPDLKIFVLSVPNYRRSCHIEMSLHPYWAGHEVHLWGFVTDNAGRASRSQYIGSGVLSMDNGDNDIFNENEAESGDIDSAVQHNPSNGDTSLQEATAPVSQVNVAKKGNAPPVG